jgi:hypothetical protein
MANIFGVDTNALWDKIVNHNQAADVIPSRDHVGFNANTLANSGLVSAVQSTDAYAPGGSKYVAPVAPSNPTIADSTTPTGNASLTGGAGGSGTTIDQNVLNGILQEIAGLDGGLNQAKNNNQTSYNSLMDNYNADATANGTLKDSSLNTNDLSYLASQQASLVNSAKLRQSLLGTLIGMGALNGSGVNQANSTIGGALQTDLTGADNNYKTNANTVLSSWDTYQKQNDARKKAAEQTLHNANTAADNSFATNKQDYLKTLAGLYPTGSTQGGDFLRQALALGPQIQATSNVPQYDFSPITAPSYNAPDLSKFLSGTNSLSVAGPNPGAGIGAFSTNSKKRTDTTAPLALTTAPTGN